MFDALKAIKRIQKIIRENTSEIKKKISRFKFNPGLALIGLRTTFPRFNLNVCGIKTKRNESNELINKIKRNAPHRFFNSYVLVGRFSVA